MQAKAASQGEHTVACVCVGMGACVRASKGPLIIVWMAICGSSGCPMMQAKVASLGEHCVHVCVCVVCM